MSIKIVAGKKYISEQTAQGGMGHLAQSQKLGLSGWKGKMNSPHQGSQEAERVPVCMGSFPFPPIFHQGYMVMSPTLREGSPPLLLMGSPSQTHSEAYFRNLLGRSQCNQANRQD